MHKTNIRKKLLSIRNNLPNKPELSELICNKVIAYINSSLNNFNSPDNLPKNNESYKFADSQLKATFFHFKIASFLSLPDEINTSLINSTFDTYLPIIHPTIKHGLWFTKDKGSYYKNKYKISEPIYKITDIVAPWELDIIIVPIVGFNKNKYRMGMGGGFYDYSLSFKKSHKKPITIGIAFDEQQNNDIIIDTYDIQLDAIITPTRIL